MFYQHRSIRSLKQQKGNLNVFGSKILILYANEIAINAGMQTKYEEKGYSMWQKHEINYT